VEMYGVLEAEVSALGCARQINRRAGGPAFLNQLDQPPAASA
jgi:hypothetical protein